MKMISGIVTVMFLCLATTALAQVEKADPRIINTQGESVVYVVPDEAVVSFGIETHSQNLDTAKTGNDKEAARLLAAIKELKIEPKHIHTDVMNVSINYKSGSRMVIEGYICQRSYSITLKDVKLFEKLIDTALKNGANQLSGFEFKTTELRKHRDQARKMAIKAAKEKAVDLAKELDCKVGKPRNISESGSAGYYGGLNRYNNAMQNSFQVNPGGANEDGETMPLGQISIRANVSVTFDLEP